MSVLSKIQKSYLKSNQELTVEEFLKLCKKDPSTYASPAERMLKAIGEPMKVDTKGDPKLRRIFKNQIIKVYPAFKEFYGMEDTIDNIVSYFKHSAQGLEESKQILYLLGPVGGGKSSLAEKLKSLIQEQPIYVLKAGDQISPVFESPLGLFADYKADLDTEYGIAPRYVPNCMSPWATKRLEELEGDTTKFNVVKLYPSIQKQQAISKTEPGDENNQDISTLVGKVDIRQLGDFSQADPDAYSFSGGLCLGNQGVLEFVEMFKAPIKVLHPLLTATQEKNYKGTEAIGAIPFNGIILAHSNESEWDKFSNDICTKLKIAKNKRANSLTEDEILRIREFIDQNYKVEGDLRREVSLNIKRLVDLATYRGSRHKKKLPVRGQRTRCNARTRKGKAIAIAGKKLTPLKK